MLAQSCGSKVGKVIQSEEIKRGVRASGLYGDYDYGDYGAFAVAAAEAGELGEAAEPASRVAANRRVVFLKYRIRYELI